MFPCTEAAKVFGALLADDNIRRATLFLSPGLTFKATRIKRVDKRDRSEHYVVSIGKPNYNERQRIKVLKKVGEPFPVKKVALTFFPDLKSKKGRKARRKRR